MSAAPLVAAPSVAMNPEHAAGPVGEDSYTRFERARILGARALQVSLGAPILTDVAVDLIDPVEIAEQEFAAGVIPITVRRGPRSR